MGFGVREKKTGHQVGGMDRLATPLVSLDFVQVENTVSRTFEVEILQGLEGNVLHIRLHHF